MKFFRRSLIYIQVYPTHFAGRVIGGDRRVRRDCHSLDNRRIEIRDFSRIRQALKSLIIELAPGFSLRKPTGLMHFIPEHYVPTQHELENFKKAAEKAGMSFCWLSKWETPHTDKELTRFFRAL